MKSSSQSVAARMTRSMSSTGGMWRNVSSSGYGSRFTTGLCWMIVWRFAQVNRALNSFRSRLAALLPSDPCRRTRKEYLSRNSFCLFVNLSSPSPARLLASFRVLRYFVKSGGVRSSMLHKIRIWYQFFKIIW